MDKEKVMDALLQDIKTLQKILLYHVIGCKVTTKTLKMLDVLPITLPTLLDDTTFDLIKDKDEGGASIRGDGNDPSDPLPKVIVFDVKACNGVIHVVDQVILPQLQESQTPQPSIPTTIPPTPSPAPAKLPTILEIIQQQDKGTFSIALDVLDLTGLGSALNDPSDDDNSVTLFVPTNEAFLSLGDYALRFLIDNPDVLYWVVSYHVIPGMATSQGFAGMVPPVYISTLL